MLFVYAHTTHCFSLRNLVDVINKLTSHCKFDSRDAVSLSFLSPLFLLYSKPPPFPLLTSPTSASPQHETDHHTPSCLPNPASSPVIHSLTSHTLSLSCLLARQCLVVATARSRHW